MSGVSYQKYLEWERNQALVESQKKLKPVSEPPVGIVTIPDAPSTEQPSKSQDREIMGSVLSVATLSESGRAERS